MPLFRRYRRPSGLIKRFARKRRSYKRLGAGMVKNKIPRRALSTWSAPFTFAKDPMPAYEDIVMRYTWRAPLVTNASANLIGNTEVFDLNNCYDPRVGSSSVTTPGFANMNARYLNWVVVGCLVDVSLDVPGATSEVYLACMFCSSGGSTTLTGQAVGTAESLQNVGYSKLSPYGNRYCHVKKYVDIAALDGIPKMAVLSNNEYWGTNTTAPTNGPFMRIGIGSADTTATSIAATAGITIIFKVRWFNRVGPFTN